MCEDEEEGKVRQGHTKGRVTLDGETGEETVKKMMKEQKMEAWMERCRPLLGEWVKAKTGSHFC